MVWTNKTSKCSLSERLKYARFLEFRCKVQTFSRYMFSNFCYVFTEYIICISEKSVSFLSPKPYCLIVSRIFVFLALCIIPS